MKKIIQIAWVIVLVATVTHTIHYFYHFHNFCIERVEEIENQFRSNIDKINSELMRGFRVQEQLVADFTSSPSKRSLEKALKLYPGLVGIQYVKVNEDYSTYEVLVDNLDFLFLKREAFENKTGWVAARRSFNSFKQLGYFSSKVYDPDSKQILGYLIGVYRLPETRRSLDELTLSFSTFAEIIDAEGKIIMHPFIFTEKEQIESGDIDIPPDEAYSFPDSNGWKIIYWYMSFEPLSLNRVLLFNFLAMIILWCATVILTLAVFLKAYKGTASVLYILSFVYTLSCGLIIGIILYQYETHSFVADLDISGLKEISDKLETIENDVILVPTSIYVENFSFKSSTECVISGFITQSYPKNAPVTVGMIFPDAIITPDSKVELLAVHSGHNDNLYFSQFSLAIGSRYSQHLFPLDRRLIKLVIWPKDTSNKVLFIPDLIAYGKMNPTALPGISKTLSIKDWNLEESFFGISERPTFFFDSKIVNYTSDFRIALDRSLSGSFMTLITLFVCIIITYAIASIPVKKIESPTIGMVTIVVGIIFVVSVNESSLRQSLDADNFTYIDSIFFVYYIQLLLFTINMIVSTVRDTPFFIMGYRDNLVPKLTYWPILFTAFTAIFWLALL